MKKLIIMFALIFLVSCIPTIEEKPIAGSPEYLGTVECVNSNTKKRIYVYVIDSCEYVGYINNSQVDFLAHKGDCNNPKHICNE